MATHPFTARIPSDEKLADIGKLVLRIAIAGLMLFHGVDKIVRGIGGLRELMAKNGLPEVFAYGVYVGEVVAPLLILFGFLSRPAALVFAFNMLVAIVTAHRKDVFRIGSHGEYGLEVPALFMLGALVIALIGPGQYSLSRNKGWRLG